MGALSGRGGRLLGDCFAAVVHRAADGIRSGGERNLIGRRTESDRMADAIRSGGGRERCQKSRNHNK